MALTRVTALAELFASPRGATRPPHVRCDDGRDYVVKLADSNVTKLAANERICALLAEDLGLPVLPFAIVEVTRELATAAASAGGRLSHAGVHFGVLKAVDFVHLQPVHIPLKWLANPSDVARAVAFDNWILNNDRANPDNILLIRRRALRKFEFRLIDHGQAFIGPGWTADSMRSYSTFRDPVMIHPWCANAVESIRSFSPTLEAIRRFPEERIQRAANEIPPEWLHSEAEREALIYALTHRRELVEPILRKAARGGRFENWRETL